MRRILCVLGALVCAGSVGAAELDVTPLQRDLQFNFNNPGARALGMGGAFLGRADDASAAEANPAGLTIISKRELTVEFRNSKSTSRLPGTILPASGNLPDRFVQGNEYSSSKSGPTFAAFAMPLGPIAIAAYYHQPLNYEPGLQTLTDAQFRQAQGNPNIRTVAFFPGNFTAAYKSTTVGVAAAGRVGQFSLGGSARRTSLDVESRGTTFGVLGNTNTLRSDLTLSGSGSATTFAAGFLWASSTENLTIGGVYKKGASFEDINKTLTQRYAGVASLATPTINATTLSSNSSFQVPDRYGIGMSLRFPNGLTLNEDIVRVKYSQLLTGFTSGVFCETFSAAGYSGTSGKPNPFCTADAGAFGFKIVDATEVHLGAEYLIPSTSIALRVGAWVDPAHRPFFDPSSSAGQTASQNIVNTQSFVCQLDPTPKTNGPTQSSTCLSPNTVLGNARTNATINLSALTGRETHFSAGVGYVARVFEIHAGIDRSSRSSTASVQVLTRF